MRVVPDAIAFVAVRVFEDVPGRLLDKVFLSADALLIIEDVIAII